MNEKKLVGEVWGNIRREAHILTAEEPVLASLYQASVLNHSDFSAALAFQLATILDSNDLPAMLVRDLIEQAMLDEPNILISAVKDILAYIERDPACDRYIMPFLYFKGFHALQIHRVAHYLWVNKRCLMSHYLQNQCVSVLTVDIHPAVVIGSGIMLDHATGVVMGETATVGDNVSLLHQVTLGGCGISGQLRHPQVGDGVLIASGATLLGAINVGEGAKIAAGSLVLEDVAPHVTVAGVPAAVVGQNKGVDPARDMIQSID